MKLICGVLFAQIYVSTIDSMSISQNTIALAKKDDDCKRYLKIDGIGFCEDDYKRIVGNGHGKIEGSKKDDFIQGSDVNDEI